MRKYLMFDFYLLFYIIILSLTGILFAYSSNIHIVKLQTAMHNLYIRQIIYFLTGILLMLGISIINYKKIAEHAYILYLISIVILIATLIIGKKVNNAKRWISFGFVSLQTSEFVKIFMIIVIGNYLDKHQEKIKQLKYLLLLFSLVMIPVFLIFMQPDLGTAFVFIPITLVMLFIGGVNIKYFSGILLMGVIAVIIPLLLTYNARITKDETPLLYILSNKNYLYFLISFLFISALIIFLINLSMRNLFLNNVAFFCFIICLGFVAALLIQNILKPYQIERMLSFINPELDKIDMGYNVTQSKITIGSGGLYGKGLFKGTQGQLGFLPARNTDFIFSVIGEELGFLGSTAVIFIYFLFLARLIKIAKEVKDYLGGIIVSGIITMFVIQIFINIGMTIGLAPITGLPLPFITYGGSTMWTSMIAVGIVLNIESRKYVHKKLPG
ncbi:MAG TPA: rod shape-determining protein RodA [Spirochaetota bacterium]|nr:rod shape-determining protein RodA [Spirochaetota bacterium]